MSTTITINTYKELQNFRDNVNNGTNTAKTVKLGADIDMNGDDWTPIGYYYSQNNQKYYSGTFDGQGYVIKNMKIDIIKTKTSSGQNLYNGLFSNINGTIQNVTLINPIIYSSSDQYDYMNFYVSFLCGYQQATGESIKNCKIINGHIDLDNKSTNKNYIKIGCICSYVSSQSSCIISNCFVEVELNIKNSIVFMFGGIAYINSSLNRCGVQISGIVDMNLKIMPSSSNFCGLTYLSSTSVISNCYVINNLKYGIKETNISLLHNWIMGVGYSGSSSAKISNTYTINNIDLTVAMNNVSYHTYCYAISNNATCSNCYSINNVILRKFASNNYVYFNANNTNLTTTFNISIAQDSQYTSYSLYKSNATTSTTLEDDLLSGKICYLLNNNSSSNVNFYQLSLIHI